MTIRETGGSGDLEAFERVYEAYDREGRWVGGVQEVLVDERDSPEYVGIAGSSVEDGLVLVPVEKTSVREDLGVLRVSEDRETILDAPSFGGRRISPEYEVRLRSHYGLEPRRRNDTPPVRKPVSHEGAGHQPTPRAESGESGIEGGADVSKASPLLVLVVAVLALAVVYEAVARLGRVGGRKMAERARESRVRGNPLSG